MFLYNIDWKYAVHNKEDRFNSKQQLKGFSTFSVAVVSSLKYSRVKAMLFAVLYLDTRLHSQTLWFVGALFNLLIYMKTIDLVTWKVSNLYHICASDLKWTDIAKQWGEWVQNFKGYPKWIKANLEYANCQLILSGSWLKG